MVQLGPLSLKFVLFLLPNVCVIRNFIVDSRYSQITTGELFLRYAIGEAEREKKF